MMGSGIQRDDIKVLRDLSLASLMRGRDGTGFAFGSSWQPKTIEIAKTPSDVIYWEWEHFKDEDFIKRYTKILSNNFYLGHTRSSTSGEDTHAATHPFDFTNLIGMHNGTLHSLNWEGYANDSEKLYSLINAGGVENAISHLEEGDAYALVWFDKKTKKVNFLRNKERTLHFAIHPTRTVMYWYSEEKMLRAVLARNGIEPRGNSTYYFQPHYHYQFDPTHIVNHKDQTAKYEVSSITPEPKRAHNSNVVPFTTNDGRSWDEVDASERERMLAVMGDK